MIRLATLAPGDLNLNGDQGNVQILTKYLNAAGFETKLISVEYGEQLPAADFYFVGHGSDAAMDYLDGWLSEALGGELFSGKPSLVVGSGAIKFAAVSGIPVQTGLERVSEFQTESFEDFEVLGYRNSDTDLPNIQRSDNCIISMLHGPVLAKNPALLDWFARLIIVAAQATWPVAISQELGILRKDLLRICDEIWLLEAEKKAPRGSL